MAKVIAQPGQSVDDLIRKFNRKVQSEGILQELRKREHHMSPAEKRQQKLQVARKKYIRSKTSG